jgi:hypothetical protein
MIEQMDKRESEMKRLQMQKAINIKYQFLIAASQKFQLVNNWTGFYRLQFIDIKSWGLKNLRALKYLSDVNC